MTGLESLICEMETQGPKSRGHWVRRARALLLEEQKAVEAVSSKGDEGLREFVVRIVERAKYLGHSRVDLPVRILEKSLEMYPSHPVAEQEPLAVLADRKGWWLSRAKHFPDRWVLNFDCATLDIWTKCEDLAKPIIAPTYPAAESAARKFLEGLPDRPTTKENK